MIKMKRKLSRLIAMLFLAAAVLTDSIPADANGLETGRIYASQNETKAGKEGIRFGEIDDESDREGIDVVGYVGSETEIRIPSEAFLDGDEGPYRVTGISDRAFKNYSNLTGITMPEGITYIGEWAFSGCSSLKNVSFPDGISNIANGVFSGCSSLESITLPESLTEIGQRAFENCSSLKSIRLPDGISSIESGAFNGCSSLESITLPDSLVSLNHSVFNNCNSLKRVTVPAGFTGSMPSFVECSGLEELNINSGHPSYVSEDGIVYNKDKTQMVYCPRGRKSAAIPASVTDMDLSMFDYCDSLEELSVDDGNPAYSSSDGILYGKDKKTLIFCPKGKKGNVIIPDGVTGIEERAFAGCGSVENITIPDSVTSVGIDAFKETKWLEEKKKINPLVIANHVVIDGSTCSGKVVIPEGVTVIAKRAFTGNLIDAGRWMTSVTIPSSMTSIDGWTFSKCAALRSAVIPGSVKSIGKEAFGWYLDPDNYHKVDGFIIYGESGTEAERYAKENGFEFRLISDNPSQGGGLKTDISKATVTLAQDSYTYDGKPKTPSVTVKLNGKTLVAGTDYSVSYGDNTSVGTAKVTVTGKGSYKGSVAKTFSIKKAASGIVCKKTVYDVAYGIKPFTLRASADGALSYSSSAPKVAAVDQKGKVTVKGAGVAYITIRAGSDSLKITIKASPKKQTVSSVKANKGRKITVKWKKDGMATGYQVQCSTDRSFKKGTATADAGKGNMTSISIGRLKAGKKYYLRIRTYKTVKINGKSVKLYSEWSKAKTAVTKK